MSFISMGDVDLLHPPRELEQRRHKLKRLVQSPNSFFMDVKCPGCFTINTVRMRHVHVVAVPAWLGLWIGRVIVSALWARARGQGQGHRTRHKCLG